MRTDYAFLHLEHAANSAPAPGVARASLQLIGDMVCDRAPHCPLHQNDQAGTTPDRPRKPARHPLIWEGDDA